ncbi:MAG: OmpA family protein [Betaproteobacteria bacterium]|nr:OmpA family protein [Betaproteobacteria bacterium]
MIRTSTLHAIERLLLASFLLLAATEAIAQHDVAGSRDHPLFTRMTGFYIEEYTASDFGSHAFPVEKAGGEIDNVTVEGRKTQIGYRIREGAKQPSALQIVRNFINASAPAGGKVLFDTKDPGNLIVTLRLAKGGKEIWVGVETAGDQADAYLLTIVEKGEMTQEITANAIFDELSRQGRIALYILFDTGKATIRPESQPIVKQVVDMMKAHPEVKVAVEGHTDNVGAPAANRMLSEQRARAVVAAITAQGVASERLIAAGFGQDKPVASNANEDGRARNRRVELVRR